MNFTFVLHLAEMNNYCCWVGVASSGKSLVSQLWACQILHYIYRDWVLILNKGGIPITDGTSTIGEMLVQMLSLQKHLLFWQLHLSPELQLLSRIVPCGSQLWAIQHTWSTGTAEVATRAGKFAKHQISGIHNKRALFSCNDPCHVNCSIIPICDLFNQWVVVTPCLQTNWRDSGYEVYFGIKDQLHKVTWEDAGPDYLTTLTTIILRTLTTKHLWGINAPNFSTPFWDEMVCVGTRKSLDSPPQVQMFTGKRKQKPDNEMSTVFTELAKSVVNVLSPQTRSPTTNSGGVVNLQTYTFKVYSPNEGTT